MSNPITSKSMDELFSSMPTGSLDKAILNNLRGINHRQIQGMIPMNRDMAGLTFFVRPQLNMQPDNIRNVRQMAALLSQNSVSIQTYIRCMLDPRLMTGVSFSSGFIQPIGCPLVDNMNPFIPILTNNLTSISGWPDISVPTFTSTPGLYNESYSMVDGRVINKEVFDLTANFRNTRGDPVLYLFYIWVLYSSMVFEGKLVPYIDMISENEIDYNTRIYRIVLDYQKRYVTKITACNAAFPSGVPVGEAFNVPGDKPYLEANQEISMRFKCMGVDYFDDILVREFNETVVIFNPHMHDSSRQSTLIKVPPALIQAFNNYGYPRINPDTTELEWWVFLETYNKVAGNYLSNISTDNYDLTGD